MPTYDYVCSSCGHEFETFQSIKAASLEDCPVCTKPKLRRKIGLGAGIIFKGGGFYETDYKRANSQNKNAASSSDMPAANKAEPSAKSAVESAN